VERDLLAAEPAAEPRSKPPKPPRGRPVHDDPPGRSKKDKGGEKAEPAPDVQTSEPAELSSQGEDGAEPAPGGKKDKHEQEHGGAPDGPGGKHKN
jgi:hypothetical protein